MLEVRYLNVGYGDVQALWDLSFTVREHELVSLIGANGAGKSTTLQALAGMLRPFRGTIMFEGQSVAGLPPHDLVARGISLVPEARQLWAGMTVAENLELGAYSVAARRHRMASLRWVYDLFPRLWERRRQKAGTLSGGEQQMCAIGRGLMSCPRLLLLDEPSLGLAPKLVAEVFEVIKEVHNRGVTVLLIEQNVHLALRVADRAYVLENGRVTLEGAAAALVGNEEIKVKFLGLHNEKVSVQKLASFGYTSAMTGK